MNEIIAKKRNVSDLAAYWMPFTANRQFKAKPRLLARAEGLYYYTPEGRQIADGTAGLWCVNAGHGRKEIVGAVQRAVAELDYAPSFNMGHPLAFEFATKMASWLPADMGHVFYANSGSEAVDTALKIALAYHRVRGEGQRARLIGRERGYHGVGFGGTAVGGIVNNRKFFGPLLPGVDHLPHTHSLKDMAFSRGQPEWGAHLADELERIVALHDASTIAAVIVEPVAGSAGVLVPPKGYLDRLRAICDRHGILLIFDEVITGFGRLGRNFAFEYFGVKPDLVTVAKGITNATVPMGAVFASDKVHDAFMVGPEGAIELFHGYTYSGHPLACAAGLATLAVHEAEGIPARAAALAPYFADALHGLKGAPHVVDVRNLGLMGAVEMAPRPGAPGARGYDAHVKCFEAGALVRYTADTVAFSPPLVSDRAHIDRLVDTLRQVLGKMA
jgi:beta-alanine--pyruvate transaminase